VSAQDAILGRAVRFLPNDEDDESIFGIRSKSITFIGEALDSTSDDDDSWQKFHHEAPRRGISITAEGIAKGGLIKRVAQEGNVLRLTDWTLYAPNVGTWTGNWVASGFGISAETDALATFSGTINSDGALVFAPDEDYT
jgi:predicted secreted protein